MNGGRPGKPGKGGAPGPGKAKDGKKADLAAWVAAGAAIAAASVAYSQWWVARDAEQRQLRAYVMVERSELRNFGSDKPIYAVIELKNFGATPAYEVRRQSQLSIGPFPSEKIPPLPPLVKTTTIIAPGAEGYLGLVKQDSVLTPTQIGEIKAGRQAVYADGAISYLDAFGVLRCTRYRQLFRGNLPEIVQGEGLPLEHAEDGNSADENCAAIPVEK